MTEVAGPSSADPHALLGLFWAGGMAGERKFRLWACACLRRVWPLLTDPRSRRLVEDAERMADGEATQESLVRDREAVAAAVLACEADLAYLETHAIALPSHARHGALTGARLRAAAAGSGAGSLTLPTLRLLSRDTARVAAWGDEARQAAVASAEVMAHVAAERAAQCQLLCDIFGPPASPPPIGAAILGWGGGLVGRLAAAAYQERRLPGGTLDDERLAVLADALEEVRADAGLMWHLRQPGGVHVRGCHVVDLLLGKA